MKKHASSLIIIFILAGCAGSNMVSDKSQNQKVRYSVVAGANSGGIVENTDMSTVEGAPVDAFTGATKIGFHAGANVTVPVRRNDIQAGVLYLFSPQTFTYADMVNDYSGKRSISLSQLVIPATFNLSLLKEKMDQGTLSLKIGGALEYNIPSVTDDAGNLTDYNFKRLSGGITLGLSCLPFKFDDLSKLGFSFDIYRGGQIFNDFYNLKANKPGSSYMKFSVIYQFK